MMYDVVVGNIGLVARTNSPIEARRIYGEYKRLSELDYGRASGETVTIIRDDDFGGEIELEHVPKLSEHES